MEDDWQCVDDHGISVEEFMHEWQWIDNNHGGNMVEEISSFMDVPQYLDDPWNVEALLSEVHDIESGRVEPTYSEESLVDRVPGQNSLGSGRGSVGRSKGTPWTEDEHRLFLIGLEKYGKGEWESISRHAVVSRTPVQVAIHAQKYYVHHFLGKNERKRSSIFDITKPTNITMPAPTNLPG